MFIISLRKLKSVQKVAVKFTKLTSNLFLIWWPPKHHNGRGKPVNKIQILSRTTHTTTAK